MAMNTAAPRDALRPAASFNDPRLRSLFFQAALLLAVLGVGWLMISTLNHNRAARGITTGYGFLHHEAGFAIAESPVPYAPSDSYGRAFLVGVANTLKVSAIGIILATALGFVLGIGRLSSNWLVSKLASAYVGLVRNVPLLAQLLFWAGLIRISAPSPRRAFNPLPGVFVSNRGIQMPSVEANPATLCIALAAFAALVAGWSVARWARRRQERTGQPFHSFCLGVALLIGLPVAAWLAVGRPTALEWPVLNSFNFEGGWTLSPEFATMLVGLTVHTASYIAEIVRGGLLAVPRGQTEAARALGLHPGTTLRRVVLPQAASIIVPPLTSQYLNLIKNSSLAVVIGYPDLVSIGNTVGNQTGQVVEAISIFMAVYLLASLSISTAMNVHGRRLALKER